MDWVEILRKSDESESLAKQESRSLWQETLAKVDTFTTMAKENKPSLADSVTLVSYGLGMWWTMGGPRWAGVASIVGDEIDGRIARATNTTSERGSALDWGADVTLTPLALMRLGRSINQEHPTVALLAAPPLLYMQATLRSNNYRPAFGSVRAAVMLSSMAIESWKGK